MTTEKVSSHQISEIIFSNRKRALVFLCLLLLVVLPANGADDTNPALVLGGASPTEGLVLSTTATDFTRTVQIINTTNDKIIVTVELPDLIGPDSKSGDPFQSQGNWRRACRPTHTQSLVAHADLHLE